jgi:hypothetical protein
MCSAACGLCAHARSPCRRRTQWDPCQCHGAGAVCPPARIGACARAVPCRRGPARVRRAARAAGAKCSCAGAGRSSPGSRAPWPGRRARASAGQPHTPCAMAGRRACAAGVPCTRYAEAAVWGPTRCLGRACDAPVGLGRLAGMAAAKAALARDGGHQPPGPRPRRESPGPPPVPPGPGPVPPCPRAEVGAGAACPRTRGPHHGTDVGAAHPLSGRIGRAHVFALLRPRRAAAKPVPGHRPLPAAPGRPAAARRWSGCNPNCQHSSRCLGRLVGRLRRLPSQLPGWNRPEWATCGWAESFTIFSDFLQL